MTKFVDFGHMEEDSIQHCAPMQAIECIRKVEFYNCVTRGHQIYKASCCMHSGFTSSWNSNSELTRPEVRLESSCCKRICAFRCDASPRIADSDGPDAARFLF